MSIPPSRYVFARLPWYSTLIVIGAAIAVWLASREEERAGLPKDTMIDLALRMLPIGILGARVYYIVFSWDVYRENPISMLYVWEGGLAIYGGLIAGFCCAIFFCRKRKLLLLTVCDTLIPGVALAQAIGRWGNYFNQEAYGLILTNPGLQFFPLGVQIAGKNGLEWHLATFFLESALDFLIFLFLMLKRKEMRGRKGDAFFTYLFLYAAARLLVENFRMDSLYAGTVRISQLLSVVICGGILTWFTVRIERKEKKKSQTPLRHGIPKTMPRLLQGCVLLLLLVYCVRQELLPLNTPKAQGIFLLVAAALLVIIYLYRLKQKQRMEDLHADNQA